jgi:arylsulfatase A-like enzyme
MALFAQPLVKGIPMKPNILLIQAESLDGRALGCMAEPGAYTPNLDRLAERGVLFENAYCNSPQCCPSRSSMWSGRYVWQVGAWNNYRGLPNNETTFVDDLGNANYQCGVLGRTDHRSGHHSIKARMSAWVRSAPDPLFCNQGPRFSLNEKGRRQRNPDWHHMDRCKEWIATEWDQTRPFFMHLGLYNTHPGAGYNTSTYWLEKIDCDKVAMPPQVEETHPVMKRMLQTKGCDRAFDPDTVRKCRQHYLAMIAEVDGLVGEVIDDLEAKGLLENTIIVFTADHGDMRMEHGQYLKNTLYEGSTRVPLIVAGPGIVSGHRVSQPVSLLDLYPSLMDWAGAEGREDLAGVSLAPIAAGESVEGPTEVFCEYHSNFQQTGSFMLRQGPWKYIAHVGYNPQLFNLESDPDEVNDVSMEKTELCDEMDRKLKAIVDYEAADAAAKLIDAGELATWRLRHKEDEYLTAMSDMVQNWDEEIAGRFAEWSDQMLP